jgi:hypothetical protein
MRAVGAGTPGASGAARSADVKETAAPMVAARKVVGGKVVL